MAEMVTGSSAVMMVPMTKKKQDKGYTFIQVNSEQNSFRTLPQIIAITEILQIWLISNIWLILCSSTER